MFVAKTSYCNMRNFYSKSQQQLEEHLKSHHHDLKRVDITPFGGGIVPGSVLSAPPPINPITISTEFLKPNLPSPDLLQSSTSFRKENPILANLLQGKDISASKQAGENDNSFSLLKGRHTPSPVSTLLNNTKSMNERMTVSSEEPNISSNNNFLSDILPMNNSFQDIQFNKSTTQSVVSAPHKDMISIDETESQNINVSDIVPVDCSSTQHFQFNEIQSSLVKSAVCSDAISMDETVDMCNKGTNINVHEYILPMDNSSAYDFQSNERLTQLEVSSFGNAVISMCDEDSYKSLGDILTTNSSNVQDFQLNSHFSYMSPENSNEEVENTVSYYNDIDLKTETEFLMNSEIINKVLDDLFQNPQCLQSNEVLPLSEDFSYNTTYPVSLNGGSCNKGRYIFDFPNFCSSDKVAIESKFLDINSDFNYFPKANTKYFISNISHNDSTMDSNSSINFEITESGDFPLNDQFDSISDEISIISVVKNDGQIICNRENLIDKNLLRPEDTFSCTICPFKCNIKSVIENHMQLHQPREGAKFKCFVCPYFASTKHSVQIHLKDHHSLIESNARTSNSMKSRNENQSKTCTQNASQILEFQDREQQKSNELKAANSRRNKLSYCPECPYRTSRRKNFTNHRNFHTSLEYELKCKFCSFGTNNQSTLNSHIRLHRASDSKLDVFLVNGNNDKQITISCQLCPWKGDSKSKFQLHSKEHASLGKFPCPYCGFQAATSRGFSLHLRNHGRRVKIDNIHVKTSVKSNTKNKDDITSLGTKEVVINKKHGLDESNVIQKEQRISFENEVQYPKIDNEYMNINHQIFSKLAQHKFKEILKNASGFSLEHLRVLLMKLNRLHRSVPIEYFLKHIEVVSPLEFYRSQKSLFIAIQDALKEPPELTKLHLPKEENLGDDSEKYSELCYKDGKLFFTN